MIHGRSRSVWWLMAVGVLVVPLACTDDTAAPDTSSSPTTTVPATEPAPAVPPRAMCPEGDSPMVAAYSLLDGAFRWVACTPNREMYIVAAASDGHVWVERTGVERLHLLLDAATGELLTQDATTAYPGGVPAEADTWTSAPPVVDGVSVRGGQDDPLVAVDVATGTVRWGQPNGHPFYDNVWAVGDGAVFVNSWDPANPDRGSGIAAYEIADGSERWWWSSEEGAAVWHATDRHVYALGADLWVLSADDGALVWTTGYGPQPAGSPRMFGVLANETTVFVSFTMVGSDGD